MSDEKQQIEEMARKMCRNYQPNGSCAANGDPCHLECIYGYCAERIYCAGYRKQVEGYWFIVEYEYFTCSECGYYHPNGCDYTKQAKERLADGKHPKYCPNCGAKMKGAKE